MVDVAFVPAVPGGLSTTLTARTPVLQRLPIL